SAPSSPAVEALAAIGLESRNARAGRHLELFQNVARSRIDAPDVALITFPCGVPQLSVDPRDARDEAVRRDRAEHRSRLGIDLIALAVAMLANPERPFGPRESRVAAAPGRGDRRNHPAGLRIDLLDAILGELIQVRTVPGRSGVRGDFDRPQRLPACGIEGV